MGFSSVKKVDMVQSVLKSVFQYLNSIYSITAIIDYFLVKYIWSLCIDQTGTRVVK